jgi:hypothetical protein
MSATEILVLIGGLARLRVVSKLFDDLNRDQNRRPPSNGPVRTRRLRAATERTGDHPTYGRRQEPNDKGHETTRGR